jgi:hypothetical protein
MGSIDTIVAGIGVLMSLSCKSPSFAYVGQPGHLCHFAASQFPYFFLALHTQFLLRVSKSMMEFFIYTPFLGCSEFSCTFALIYMPTSRDDKQ